MKEYIKIIVLFFLVQYSFGKSVENTKSRSNRERFLSLFTIINFKNSECNNGEGICYGMVECLFNGGTIVGSCAEGRGSCCVTAVDTCGGSGSNNGTYLRNPNYPSAYTSAGTCEQTVTIKSNICQVRLEITTIDLVAPTEYGLCENDYLIVDQDTKFTRICGLTNTNHFYLDVTESTDLKFTFTTDSTSHDRNWNIKVNQIACDQGEKAPPGCGQYYTEDSGTIKGLNQDLEASKYYLDGLSYAICIRQNFNKCSTTYTEAVSFFPNCIDVFERPFGDVLSNYFDVCQTAPSTSGSDHVSNHLGADFFYFYSNYGADNKHILSDNLTPSNYNMVYVQANC